MEWLGETFMIWGVLGITKMKICDFLFDSASFVVTLHIFWNYDTL